MNDDYDFSHLQEITQRAFLATTFFDGENGKKQRMSDQARRLGLLIVQLTFGRGRPGLWVRKQSHLARALSIDEGDCCRAEATLADFKLLRVQERGDWRWYELTPSVMALQPRASGAQAAMTELEKAHNERAAAELLSRRAEELMDAGMGDAMADVDREIVIGKVPIERWESPNWELGKSQRECVDVGKVPIAQDYKVRARAPVDSYDSIKTSKSYESGQIGRSGAAGGSDRRFKDDEKNYVFEMLKEVDTTGELNNEASRRTWIARIRDHLSFVQESVGEIRDQQRRGVRLNAPLGAVYVRFRKYAKEAGKVVRMFLF
jgi:hypothetical protein